MSEKIHTIKDIAELTGLSKGTVDRVLHNRGGVSKKSYEKINKVLREIDFKPNPIARNLRKNIIYKICILIPDAKEDAYWLPAYKGINEAKNKFKAFGVIVEEYRYHPFKSSSYIYQSKKAILSKPNALLMAPLFHIESLEIIKECKENKIIVSLFNNLIDTLNTNNFIGQNLYKTGRLAANLIDKTSRDNSEIAIIHINEEPHMRQKEIGFRDYFNEKKENRRNIITCKLSTVNTHAFKKDLFSFLKSHQNLSAIFVTNSKVHLVAEQLCELKTKINLIGYDLLDENITYLGKDIIDFLIHQNPKRQAYLSVLYLAEHFLYKKIIPVKSFLPIEIIAKENIDFL